MTHDEINALMQRNDPEFRAAVESLPGTHWARYDLAAVRVGFELGQRSRVASAPYNAQRIGWELERTAMGDGHHGNALRVAMDVPGITAEDKAVLQRYATGRDCGTDHVALQEIAMKVYGAPAQ